MSEQLHKDIEKAFDFHPYNMNEPELHEGWVAGPTFLVWAPEYKPKERDRKYSDPPSVAPQIQSMVRYTPEAGRYTLDGQRQKHGDKCSGRFVRNGTGEVVAELAFPLARLAYKLKADRYSLTEGGMLYAYRPQEILAMVGVFKVKEGDTCQT